MAIRITPELLEHVYELLRLTPPMCHWKLPHADDIVFHVAHSDNHGRWWMDAQGRHNLMVSDKKQETLALIEQTVAHEMCHIHTLTERALHGAQFKRAASLVCRYHKWDSLNF